MVTALVQSTQGGGGVNTAYIERLACLVRRQETLHLGMYLVSTIYNVTYHTSLTKKARQLCTPAMAAGLTDHRWSIHEL